MGKLVQQIIQGEITRHFTLQDRRIERQSTTVLPVNDGAGSRVIVRGQTNLTASHWAIYEGQYGHWQCLVTPSGRVKPAHELVAA